MRRDAGPDKLVPAEVIALVEFVRGVEGRYRPILVKSFANIRGLGACVVLALSAGLALGQGPVAPPPEERASPEVQALAGRMVSRVTLALGPRAAGEAPEPLDPSIETLARNSVRMSPGTALEPALISEDLSRLTRLGRFRSAEGRAQLLSDGSVEVTYLLTLQPIIESVQTVGNREFSDEDLGVSLSVLEGTPIDPTQLERACRRIEALYREKGFYSTLVTVDEGELEKNQIAVFRVREGPKSKVASIRFEGLKTYLPEQIKSDLKTKEAWLLERGPIDPDLLDEDIATIIKFFKDRGHLDIRVDRVITPSPDGREAIVTFVLDEGPIYTLRDLHLEFAGDDAPAMTAEQLRGLFDVRAGDAYSLDRVQRAIKAIENAYGAIGYADAKVQKRELREPGAPLVDVLLTVRQGSAFKTGLITITGNTRTRDDVIRERLTISPDRPLDSGELEESRKRLADTRFFVPDSVKLTVQPEREDEPGYRDVLVEVDETNTGSINFGAALSADNGVIGTISLTERNFDVRDWPDSWGELFSGEAFHGGGQTFTLAVQPGDRYRNLSIGLSDPYAFGTDYSMGGSVYYRDRIYRAYDEQRIGAEVRVGRRYGSRWNLSIPFRVETIELSNIDEDAPTEYFEQEEGSMLASAGLSLSRSSLDNITFPSKGNKLEMGLELFTGDYSFAVLKGEASRYFRLRENVLGEKTVLQLTARAAYIPGDEDVAPFYQRLYMGGQTFRGFDYRAVAPAGIRNDTGGVSEDTVGGNFMFFAGAEVRHPLFTDLLSGVAFIDTGTVDEEVSFDSYRVSVGVGLRIYVEQLSPVPLAFDFGFPILKEDTDETRLFTFSIDVPFR